MTCILKSCAHGSLGACKTLAKSGLAECGAAYALDLASRNDGYMVHARNNPTIDALRAVGMIRTKPSGDDGYLVARAVHVQAPMRRGFCRNHLSGAAKIGQGIKEDATA